MQQFPWNPFQCTYVDKGIMQSLIAYWIKLSHMYRRYAIHYASKYSGYEEQSQLQMTITISQSIKLVVDLLLVFYEV